MKIHAEVTSEVEGTITDFGYVSPKEPLILTERQIRMIERKRKLKIGEIQMPIGTALTVVVSSSEDEE